MLKFQYINQERNLKAVIEEDPFVGFYLYVWELSTNKLIADTLQDTLDISQEEAEDNFKIPRNDWEQLT